MVRGCLLQNPDRKMPPNCIKYEELISILNEFSDKDPVSKDRAVATKAKLTDYDTPEGILFLADS